jgi:hypothetical protein
MQAGAAEGIVFFDHGHFEAELTGANARDVTAGTAADHNEIEVLFQENDPPGLMRRALYAV